MMKRTFAMLLAVALVLGLLPMSAVAEQLNTAYTAPLEQHEHAPSGDAHICEHCVAAGKTGAEATPEWKAWDSTKNTLPNADGHWYLTGDMTVKAVTLSNKNVVVCLNGYTVTATTGERFYTLQTGAVLTVLDCTAKTVTPDESVPNDTGYRAGKLTGSTNTAIMLSNNHNAQLYWYDGILSGNNKSTGAVMSIQGTAQVHMYGGEVRNNTSTSGACIYLGSNKNVFEAECVNFIGNTAAGNGGVIQNSYKGTVVLKDSLFQGNSANVGGVYYGSGGSLTATGCTFTGNSAKDYSVICGSGGGIAVTLDSCRITDNTCTGTDDGAVYVPNSGASLILKGDTYIYGNKNTAGEASNVYFKYSANNDSPVFTINGLTSGTKVGVRVSAERLAATKVLSKAVNGGLTRGQATAYFSCDNGSYIVDLVDDKLTLVQGHAHANHMDSCAVTGCTGHDSKIYLPLSAADPFPTSGSYYLTETITLSANVTLTDTTLDLCLNGQTLQLGGKRFNITGATTLNITDCQATGKITGGTNGVFQMNGDTDSAGKKSVVNVYAGAITGNVREKDHAAVVFAEKKSTFNLYGGEISNNTVGATSTSRGGTIYLQDSTATFNMYGGKLTGNKAVKNGTYGGNGAAVFSRDRGTVNILGGEITNNIAAAAGGAIYASGGTVTVKNAKITGNEAASTSAIRGAGGVKIILENAQITGNKATSYGTVYVPNNSSKVTVKGATQITGNQGDELLLVKDSNTTSPSHPMVNVDGLTQGAKIALSVTAERIAAQPVVSGVLNGQLTQEQVTQYFTVNSEEYTLSLQDDRIQLTQIVQEPDHVHCACNGKTQGCDHQTVQYRPWSDAGAVPTSGNYYLTVDVKTKQNVSLTSGTLNLCLNGHTIQAAGSEEGTWRDRIFDIKGDSVLNLSDCTGAGKLTGGTYGVILMEDNAASHPVLNMYAGNLTGNCSINYGGAVLVQGNSVFNMYGGEISGNNMNGHAKVDAAGNPVLGSDGAQTTTGTSGGGGAIAVYGANAVFNMYGGKIYDNECNRTLYQKADGTLGAVAGRGGAIYATRGTVNIYGGEISGNRAYQGGAIYAVINGKVNIAGGTISENTSGNHGGGIFADNCTVTVSGGKITKNVANGSGSGGGIQTSNSGCTLTITGGEITDNTAYYGGGIMNQGRAVISIEGGLIARNSADTAGGVYISTMSPAKMTGGVITENTATNNAGGLYTLRNTLDMTGGEISKNTAGKQGGALYVYGATLNFDGAVLKDNTAKNGAAISCGRMSAKVDGVETEFRPTINILSGVIEGNASTGSGGAILIQGYATLNIKGGQIKNNSTASSGGAVYVSKNCTVEMTGGTISENAAKGTGGAFYITESKANFAGGVIEKNTTKKQGAGICASHAEVVLSGVTIRNHNHTGVGAAYTSFNAKTTMTGGSIYGNYAKSYGAAFYLQRGTLTVKGGSVSNNTTKGTGAAFYVAGAKLNIYGGTFNNNKCEGSGGPVVFTARWNYTENGVKKIDKPVVNVHGGSFSNNYGRNGGVMLIQSDATLNITGGSFTNNEGPASGGVLYISTNCKFTISGGTFTGNKTNSDGGAINMMNSQGIIDGSSGKLVISENYAKRYGGGMNITGEKAEVTVQNVTVNNNSSKTRGGGIAVNTKARANFENVEITANHCAAQGGGFYVGHAPIVFLSDCKIHHNTADAAGAGVATECINEVTMERVIISENETKTKSGGIYTRAAKMHLIDCQVINNVAGGDGGGIATAAQFSRGGEIGSGGYQEGLILENTLVSGNKCEGNGGGIHVNKGHVVTIRNSTIEGNQCGANGSGIWTRETLKAIDMTITGNKSLNSGYAFYIAEVDYDGQSFIQALLEMGGDLIVRDNDGGDMYMGPMNAIAITAEGLTAKTDCYITIDSGLLTHRMLGVYDYTLEDGIYHVTCGDGSLTNPEYQPAEKNVDLTNVGLYVAVSAVAVAVVAAAVILLLIKKKKSGVAAGENN